MRDLPGGLPTRADTPVQCDRCGLTVLVGKTSWQQTSIQWPEAGPAACLELCETAQRLDSTHEFADAVRGCTTLRRAIDKAAPANTLPVADRT